jgi:hypothetical protein
MLKGRERRSVSLKPPPLHAVLPGTFVEGLLFPVWSNNPYLMKWPYRPIDRL